MFGAPAARVKGRVRDDEGARFPAARPQAAGPSSRPRPRIRACWRSCSDPFALTPGFQGPKQPPGNKPVFDEDLKTWLTPFFMANINTRNMHRSNMLMGFPYGRDFVYDEMQITGPGEEGEA